jgi:hypothetical protein
MTSLPSVKTDGNSTGILNLKSRLKPTVIQASYRNHVVRCLLDGRMETDCYSIKILNLTSRLKPIAIDNAPTDSYPANSPAETYI